jgi:hypothetical protein
MEFKIDEILKKREKREKKKAKKLQKNGEKKI